MTYVAQFVHKYPEVRSESGESIDKIQKDYNLLLTWLMEKTQYLSWSQNLSQDFLVSNYKNRINISILLF
jgi:hypothetical protein